MYISVCPIYIFIFEVEPLSGLHLTHYTRLTGYRVPDSNLPVSISSELRLQTSALNFYYEFWGLNLGLCVCRTDTLPT